ncbi:putative AP-5 complex subunit mu-1 [Apostichopus japonicus]|uniref:AP-5 complex subunit mu-1 n=1 Tax=Stichopus japonicus TaxID=307972 RepID=A0A2G8LRL4_STIJA|nr:putative AP-5 complex subunit mu-1 [Apostichopus japonicus]
MSLRGIWVFSLPGASHGILFSKKYPSVENRACILNKDGYVKLPTDDAMREAVLAELGIVHPIEMFVESRDSCSRKLQKPVFEITTSNGILWPVVLYEKFGLLLCCLPLVESVERPPVIDVLGISLGYALLLQMIDVIGPVQQGVDETHPQMVDLHSYLCQAVPFGTLTDIEQATVFDAISGRIDSSHVVSDVKPPSWRPISVKCKANISFRVTEQIQAVLYNRPDVWDVFQIYGSVSCKADLEHPAPLIAVHLSVGKDQPRLQNILVNSCVSMVDDENRTKGEGHRTITFIPPRERFVLCKYTAAISPTQLSAPNTSTTPTLSRRGSLTSLNSTTSSLTVVSQASPASLPLRAHYEMTGSQDEVKIIMKVKLSKGKNMFEYCEVQIPFHNRGPIIYKENTQSTGEIVITNDKRTLAWRIGQKFPSRSHEVTLEAKLKFGKRSSIMPGQDDPFCVGLNSFAMIYFKIPDYTHTSATIDQRSLRVQPNAKPKVTVGM